MKKIYLGLIIVGGFLTTSLQATATSGEVDKAIKEINTDILNIALESAPDKESSQDKEIPREHRILNSWELTHKTAMMRGFAWTGAIAHFITPSMLIGTPFEGGNYMGKLNPNASKLSQKVNSYSECVKKEYFFSFGLGEKIEDNDIDEMKAIAKSCAKTFYGKYFYSKKYTTREEFLMSIFTLFDEDIEFEGKFHKNGRYIARGKSHITGYKNVSSRSWYAPYLRFARKIFVVNSTENTWHIGKEVTDKEVVHMLATYGAYSMQYNGGSIKQAIIVTDSNRYNFTFVDDANLILQVQ